MISLVERQLQPMTWTLFLAIVFFFSATMISIGRKKIAEKYPNVVEQILLLEHQMNAEEDQDDS